MVAGVVVMLPEWALGDLLLPRRTPLVLFVHWVDKVLDGLPVSLVFRYGVHLEVSLESSAVGTIQAVERLLPRVYSDVRLQISSVTEFPATELTHIVSMMSLFILLKEFS